MESKDEVKSSFLGTIVIRPPGLRFIGRTMISPVALKNHDFCCCLCPAGSLINGIKMSCFAFPSASQDTETLSCAETSIWSTMEYFGNRYKDYLPVFPSKIIEVISRTAYRRMIPSDGLTVQQISLALKEFGFGDIVYSREAYGDLTFRRILNHYVESGIPIIAALQSDSMGHAVVIIGHGEGDRNSRLEKTKWNGRQDGGVTLRIKDVANSDYKYVIIDDNYPPYQLASFDKPAQYYENKEFQDLQITNIVVPLYKRIYMEAYKSYSLFEDIISDSNIGLNNVTSPINRDIVVRFLLTSSRSFKNAVNEDSKMDMDLKNLLIDSSMPKFIWIAELSDEKKFLVDKVNGIIIIDATGKERDDSIVLIVYPGMLIFKNNEGKFVKVSYDFGDFGLYRNNLKGAWCQWKV